MIGYFTEETKIVNKYFKTVSRECIIKDTLLYPSNWPKKKNLIILRLGKDNENEIISCPVLVGI